MDWDQIQEHANNKMTCKKCGAVYRFCDTIAVMDSSELPGNMLVVYGCKKCGGIEYDESPPDSVHN